MHTKRFSSLLVSTGTRLVMVTAMLMTMLLSTVTPAFAMPRVSAVSVAAQAGTLTAGSAGSTTFVVTVNHVSGSGTLNAGLSVISGLPAGATASFSPATVSFTNLQTVQTSNLTISTSAASPAVTAQSFTVRAVRTTAAGDLATGTGSLTIKASQAITFASLANKVSGDPDFTVSATGGASGNPITFTASGACTVTGTLVHLAGPGSCTITAHQAGNASYADALDVARTFAITLPAGPVVAFDLYAVTGTTTLPGLATPVPVWGYSTDGTAVSRPGGPLLIVNQNDTVSIVLHNTLTEQTALSFQGQHMIPDLTGAAAGGTRTYTFVASQPGTFLYEAGLLAGSQHQLAMGLYGALIVRPTGAPLQAYASSTTAFDQEQVLVLSELDTLLNSSANPAAFDMRTYAPRYFLINGKAYPATDPIATGAGTKLLLRYVDAGLQAHAMSTLGVAQTIIGQDGNAYAASHVVVAETIAPGQTLDTIIAIPATAVIGNQFTLYDANLLLRNNTGKGAFAGLGGMLTTLNVTTGSVLVTGDTTGPLVSALSLAPNPTNGAGDVTVSATLSDVTTGNANVSQAEFYVDSGAPIAMTGTFGSPSVAVTGTIPAATLATLASGNHTIYVRGRDSVLPTGNWGTLVAITLNLDKAGPSTSGLTLTPNPSSGAVSVVLSASGNDSAFGNSNVTAAEFSIDAGAPNAMSLVAGPDGPVRSFTATIPPGLPQGSHVVSVRSQDSFGNWGAASTINLIVSDTLAPITSNISASPNPNNGSTPFNTSILAVRVTADFSDASTGNSNLAAAEGFLNVAGATGTGFVFIANDGNFNSPAESGYADIPLAVVATLSTGTHPICVHAKDAAGNWGATDCSYLLQIDTLAPTVSAAVLSPSVTNSSAVVVSATASDVATGNSAIGGGEYFIDSVGTAGTGTLMSATTAAPVSSITATIPAATVSTLTAGTHTITVRAKDAAGNWSTTTSATLLIDRTVPTFSSITVTPNSIPVGTATVTLAVNGATDPAPNSSGIAGGEWWIGTTNITAGTGTAFTGTNGIAIPTSALAGGTYTVRVRIRDNAGNWSSGTNGVRTATLTITAPIPDAIFADGFESGFSAWTSRSTNTTSRLNVTSAAALAGSFGMQALGNNTNYVQYDFGSAANPATATFDARLFFNPNGNTGTNQDIFVARTTGGATVFRVRYRWNAGTPQVQIQVGNGTGNTTWTNITNGASNRIEVVWQSGGTLQLFVGANLTANQSLTATATSVGQFRVGSVTSGGSGTLEYFDAISAKRSATPYGP